MGSDRVKTARASAKRATAHEARPVAEPSTLVLVDDHAAVRAQIRSLVQMLGGVEVLGEADAGREALDLVERLEPDIVLLDVGLPDLNGIEVAKRIHEGDSGTRVLMLSMHESPEYVAGALRAGASGYLIKEDAVSELGAALETVLEGRRYFSDSLDEDAVRDLL